MYNKTKQYNSQPYYYHRNLQGDVIAIYDANGEKQESMFTEGATIDYQIIYALFTRTAHACKLLGKKCLQDPHKKRAGRDNDPRARTFGLDGVLSGIAGARH